MNWYGVTENKIFSPNDGLRTEDGQLSSSVGLVGSVKHNKEKWCAPCNVVFLFV